MAKTIEIPGESSVDWQATAMQYIELNKQKTEAIQRVHELHHPYNGGTYGTCCFECEVGDVPVSYPCPTIKALDGEQ